MDGTLLVNKPKGITSYEVVKRIKKWLGVDKVGHAGTLDPSAVGLLVVCIGRATKLTPFLQELDKAYRGRMVFGVVTSTFDEEGEIIREQDALSLTRQKVEDIFRKFQGRISQVPPMYSAIHWQGRRLYDLAREGVKVELSTREIQIYKLKLLSFSPGIHPEVEFEILCSKGTYVRSLCRDIGEVSGFGAYQSFLCRTRIGPFSLEDAVDLEKIEQIRMDKKRLREIIYSLSDSLPHFPRVVVKEGAEKIVKWGRPLYFAHLSQIPSNLEKGDRVRICSQKGDLLAIGVSLQNGFHFVKDRVGFKYLRVLIQ